jgi:hypothetical protein
VENKKTANPPADMPGFAVYKIFSEITVEDKNPT